jgi:hypothetical protein
MGRKFLVYSAGLIALYLVVVNYTGFVKDTGAASNGSVGLVKAFQGR